MESRKSNERVAHCFLICNGCHENSKVDDNCGLVCLIWPFQSLHFLLYFPISIYVAALHPKWHWSILHGWECRCKNHLHSCSSNIYTYIYIHFNNLKIYSLWWIQIMILYPSYCSICSYIHQLDNPGGRPIAVFIVCISKRTLHYVWKTNRTDTIINKSAYLIATFVPVQVKLSSGYPRR